MAQFQWTYLSPRSKRFQIGLYHSDKNGNLVVHCNSKIMIIDFGVLESKTYSFFIDDELCQLELERDGNQFRYGLHLDWETDTPLNQERRRIERSHRWKLGYMVLGLLVFVGGAVFLAKRYAKTEDPAEKWQTTLEERHELTVAQITILPASDTQPGRLAAYTYIVDGTEYSGLMRLEHNEAIYAPSGFAVEAGDEFVLKYLPERPEVASLQLDQPSEAQVARYRARTQKVQMAQQPELSYQQVNCQLEAAFSVNRLKAWADIYYQALSPDEYTAHNENSFLRLIRSADYKTALDALECY